MNNTRPRLASDDMDPALAEFVLLLNFLCCIDERTFIAWRKKNQRALMDEFQREGLQNHTYFDVWARERFIFESAQRKLSA